MRRLRHAPRAVAASLAAALLCFASAPCRAQIADDWEQEPIRYSATPPSDAIAALEKKLAAGELAFAGDDAAVMRALLASLEIPPASQTLVYSKTSFQRSLISPSTPRALFFNDDVYVGWVPGGLAEVASIDPLLGPVFYRFDPRATAPPAAGTLAAPRFVRDPDCLSCHGGSLVRGIPSVMTRSIHVDRGGEPLYRFGSIVVDESTPFADRFGGWYVTGTHGAARHRGNVVATLDGQKLVEDVEAGANVVDLKGRFDLAEHLAPGSDLVALLVLQHQIAFHNAVTRAGFQCRRMMAYQQGAQRDLKEPVAAEPKWESVVGVFDRSARDLVDVLLFKDVAPLPEGGITGDRAFQEAYAAAARRAPDGRSLRDLELKTRLYQNRCSPLIATASFAALPEPLLARVFERLAAALREKDPDPRYAHLAADERARIVAILKATLPLLPKGWLADG